MATYPDAAITLPVVHGDEGADDRAGGGGGSGAGKGKRPLAPPSAHAAATESRTFSPVRVAPVS